MPTKAQRRRNRVRKDIWPSSTNKRKEIVNTPSVNEESDDDDENTWILNEDDDNFYRKRDFPIKKEQHSSANEDDYNFYRKKDSPVKKEPSSNIRYIDADNTSIEEFRKILRSFNPNAIILRQI